MAQAIIKWIIIGLTLINAGFMGFDGTRALITGDYIRPKSGEYVGQLGPWAKITHLVGIDPESNLMKSIFILWGIMGLTAAVLFAIGAPIGWRSMLIFNILILWYLWMGTLSGVIQIVLLIIYYRINTS